MKSLIVVVGLSLAMCQADAQKIRSNEVPSSIKKSLQQNYGVKDADWDKEGNSFEANFEQKGKEISVLYDASGSVLETEREISKHELPKAVLEILKKDYADFVIEETARIDTKGVVTYETEIDKAEQSFDLIFDVNGKLLKKISKESEEKS